MLAISQRMGMDRLCKYRYKGDRCAHGMIDSATCLGEGSCGHVDAANRRTYHNDCSKDPWCGLYCAKYHRFFCAGQANCDSAKEYFLSMARSYSRADRTGCADR
jgi:hypothetical protein